MQINLGPTLRELAHLRQHQDPSDAINALACRYYTLLGPICEPDGDDAYGAFQLVCKWLSIPTTKAPCTEEDFFLLPNRIAYMVGPVNTRNDAKPALDYLNSLDLPKRIALVEAAERKLGQYATGRPPD